jgi:lycopene cyclase domain-containing protein
MAHWHYLGVLLFVGVCAIFIRLVFKPNFPGFWKLFFYTDGLILALYLTWDYWAITKKNWYFDRKQILDLNLIPRVPIEEVLFFIVVPLTTVLTFLALKKLTGWKSSEQ